MFVSKHIIFGAIISGFLLLVFPQMGLVGASIIFLSSVLIDVDHYLYFVFVKKDLSLPRAFKWFKRTHYYLMKLSIKERQKHNEAFLFLHGIEPLILLFLFSKIWFFSFYIALGFIIHLFLDYIASINFKHRLDKVFVFHEFLKYKKFKSRDGYKKRRKRN